MDVISNQELEAGLAQMQPADQEVKAALNEPVTQNHSADARTARHSRWDAVQRTFVDVPRPLGKA